ncbi:MAG: hypothetical protein AAGC95_05890 [Pseudomonadota bacterium]
MTQSMARRMPAAYRHKGVWRGVYRHIDAEGRTLDVHESRVEVLFPEEGDWDYVQRNHFTWPNGREARAELPAVYRDGALWWDTQTFSGRAWETEDGAVLLNLDRKDEPGASFFEIILMGADDHHRSRTWHWFKDGKLYKRTLCEERRSG